MTRGETLTHSSFRTALGGRVALTTLAAGLVAATALLNTPALSASQPSWRITTLPAPTGPHSFAEPLVVVRGDLAVAVAASANTGDPPTLWLSRDAGQSWSRGQDFDSTGSSTGDADAAIGRDGWIYALNLAYNAKPPGQPANPTILVFRSRDGSTWSGPASFPPPHGLDQPDRPWLVVDPENAADVDVFNSEGGGNIVVWRSQDHGVTFTGPTAVTGGANSQAALALGSRPLFDPTQPGRVYMLYETVTPGALASAIGAGTPLYEFPMSQVWLASSPDGGGSWTNQLVLDAGASTSSPLQAPTVGHLLVTSAIDQRGNLYTAFSRRPVGDTRTSIELTTSTDHGMTWSPPSAVAAPTQSNVMPAMSVSSAGTAFLSWYGSPAADFRDSTAVWSEMFAASDDPLSAHPSFRVQKLTTTPVHVGGINSAGTIGNDLGANWSLRDFQGIAADPCGAPHPVWAVDAGAQSVETATAIASCPLVSPPEAAMPNTNRAPLLPLVWLAALISAIALIAGRPEKRRRKAHRRP